MRRLAPLAALASFTIALAGCGPSYSPNTYASNAVQQANKVEEGVIAGVRPVQISAQGTVGGVAGAAAGGVAGSQVGVGPTSAFTAIGGSLVGGIAGVATEHIVGDTNGFEYMVRKANGDLVSVAQKEDKPLRVGQKVLVISGPQARVVPDYTVPFDAPAKTSAKPAVPAQPAAPESHPSTTDGAATHPPAPPAVPAETAVPPQLPAAFGSPSTAPPPIIVPPETVTPPTVSPPASTVQKPP
jgi:outer membrane lipoprotein SlyB